ncbi:nucleotide disphospho-sugar-binding domain-containing protein [Dactylosporangium sp. CS-033363]|uniref:nucleotide disphospho-sugar-binding domain-containing protein n=1 Tax=Dactylosporangium sp. CS-033363 TaxID=3239935 RepID=UPI003D909375
MRVLFAVYPSRAHLYPVAPTAWALQSAGHEVRLATFAGFAGDIAAAGLTPVPLGDAGIPEVRLAGDTPPPRSAEEVERAADELGLAGPEREHWYVFHQYLTAAAGDYVRLDRAEFADLVQFAKDWKPDLVIWDGTMPGGAIAARVSGAAHARFVFGLDYVTWSMQKLSGKAANPLAELLAPAAERYGVTIDDELLLGQRTIDPTPAPMRLPIEVAGHVPVRWVPYTGGSNFEAWLHRRPEPPRQPRIAFTLGESTRRFTRGDWDRTPRLMEALHGLDVEVVATLNATQLAGLQPPPNVRTVEWVPLTHLLPTCSALIHHGGMGTFSAASAYSVPQLVCDTEESNLIRKVVVPAEEVAAVGEIGMALGFDEDAPMPEAPGVRWTLPAKKLEATPTADYVIGFGAGARLNHRESSPEQLRKQIEQVVGDPAFREGAARLHAAWASNPTPVQIVPALEDLAARKITQAG